MMRRIFWVLVFLFLTLPSWAGDIYDEEIILLDPNDSQERFINIRKHPLSHYHNSQTAGSVYKNQSFKINQQVKDNNDFNLKLEYDDSGLYSSKYKRVDEFSIENKGKINDKYEYRANVIGNNLHSDSDDQRVYSNSYIGRRLGDSHKIYLGGSRLSESTDTSIDFLKDVESTYGKNDMGGKLEGRLEKFDYSIGGYKDTAKQHSYSNGAVAAYKPFGENSKLGQWSVGSAYYSKNQSSELNKTLGAFSYYRLNRFGIKNEYARNYYGNENNYDSNWSFAPEYALSKNLAIKTKHKQWQQTEGYINDFILEYSLKNHKILKLNDIKLQLKASYIKGFEDEDSKRFEGKAKFSF